MRRLRKNLKSFRKSWLRLMPTSAINCALHWSLQLKEYFWNMKWILNKQRSHRLVGYICPSRTISSSKSLWTKFICRLDSFFSLLQFCSSTIRRSMRWAKVRNNDIVIAKNSLNVFDLIVPTIFNWPFLVGLCRNSAQCTALGNSLRMFCVFSLCNEFTSTINHPLKTKSVLAFCTHLTGNFVWNLTSLTTKIEIRLSQRKKKTQRRKPNHVIDVYIYRCSLFIYITYFWRAIERCPLWLEKKNTQFIKSSKYTNRKAILNQKYYHNFGNIQLGFCCCGCFLCF